MSGFDGARVAVTGAAGFIGGALTRRLVAAGAEVIAVEVASEATEELATAGAEPAICDVTDAGALRAALAGTTHVFHTAALVHEWGSMAEFVEVNVGGTANVLDAATATGARVVHTSSVVVYGYDHPGEQDEEAHLRSSGIPYIDTKSASDRLARRRGAVVIRPGDVHGPGSIPWLVRPLELALAGRLAVPGTGDGVMLPVYIDDLVEALLLAAEHGTLGRAYTAWDGIPLRFDDYFRGIAEIAGTRGPRRMPRRALEGLGAAAEGWSRLRRRPPTFTSLSPTFIDRRGTVSIERIRTELGWQPRVSVAEGLELAAEWARAEGLVS